ncbi:MAG: hypothetical protein H5U11_04520 [Rhizobium sp.]|uniref:Uncharacterized protein n=1 Tax=Ciceribacter selenitireducens ATCC BAA-1503 TaxID=1336235 RepID=A0A376AJU4_9HYPH|nr:MULTISPECIES: hypothetical protein [Ciceribacter]MBC7311741.1 hypothetical protein [Rhizobium sp.]MBW8446344.1 hypothetical protein [Arenimonas sp.]MBW8284856.1 hypothetical protein [Rhizobium sp.]MBW8317851.1 hypothetical protein [Rhizobium sp.]MCA1970886.1 hypothetical protein [Rhizobium sp.]
MSAAISPLAALCLRCTLAVGLFLGPLVAVGIARSEEIKLAKNGAGLVLFVSLQRQSMS